ncbi:MAG: hypothetical protein EAZ81_13335 [Verrucomicrobia bacterium]|nr:MAG: hypothetical protein EAZ81_13335 [Verrucomicrobiota bacterium]
MMKFGSWMVAGVFCGLAGQAALAGSVTEFSPDETSAMGWSIVDDGVMGGLSQGQMEIQEDGILRFFGTLSLENRGGFSSVRSKSVMFDWSDASALRLRVKGDGRTYQLRLSTDAEYRGGRGVVPGIVCDEKGCVGGGHGSFHEFAWIVAWGVVARSEVRCREDTSDRATARRQTSRAFCFGSGLD